MIGERRGAGVFRVGPARVISQRGRPRLERAVRLGGRGERGVEAVPNEALPIGRVASIEEGQPAAVLGLECVPADLSRVVAFVEERAREEGRPVLVVADHEPVFGWSAQPESERRQLRVDAFANAIEHQRSHLVVVGRRHRIQPNAGGSGHRLGGLLAARRRGKRVPRGFVDGCREGRAGCALEPVVLGARRRGERGRKGAVVALTETKRSDLLQDAALRQAALSPNACLRRVHT